MFLELEFVLDDIRFQADDETRAELHGASRQIDILRNAAGGSVSSCHPILRAGMDSGWIGNQDDDVGRLLNICLQGNLALYVLGRNQVEAVLDRIVQIHPLIGDNIKIRIVPSVRRWGRAFAIFSVYTVGCPKDVG